VSAANVLREAADLIESDGWCRRRWEADTGERCLVTALDAAADDNEDLLHEAVSALIGRIGAPAAPVRMLRALTAWNDAPGRTVGDVTALLRAAAEDVS